MSICWQTMNTRYPFLLSIPHGGTEIPKEVRPRLLLSDEDLLFYCDPLTRDLFGFPERVDAFIDTPISRMIIDLNRPPLPLPPKDPDGVIKRRTVDGREVYRPGTVPSIEEIHTLMMNHYFPYHQRIDELLDCHPVRVAFDCHSMLPHGSAVQKDAGKIRPMICLGNNGDGQGESRPGSIATAPAAWIAVLADAFRNELSFDREVVLNDPFRGGFIANAHYWRKGIPWIQIEINRALYESTGTGEHAQDKSRERVLALKETIWRVLTAFWKRVGDEPPGKK
ncbi:MAG: N-formylglutamate amidohydrolase [Methanoregula sp.]